MRLTRLTVLLGMCVSFLACSDTTPVSPSAIVPLSPVFTIGGPSCSVPLNYATIQAAVNDAGCTTIKVAAGTYDEQVVISRALSLEGAGAATVIRPSGPATLTTLYTYPAGAFWPGTALASVVLVQNSADVRLKKLTVDGANVTTLPAGASRVAGILYGEAAGTIDQVAVTTIVVNGYTTRSYGIDLSAVGVARKVEVKNSDVTNWSRNGIQAQGGLLVANIHDNTLTGPGNVAVEGAVPNGILFIKGAGGQAKNNTITALHTTTSDGSLSAGILFYDPLTAGIVVEKNDISDVDDGITVSHFANDVIIRNNKLYDNAQVGIQLEGGATGTTISGNSITGNTIAGIRFGGPDDASGADTPPGTGNVAHGNDIVGNGIGIANYNIAVPIVFDATCNWWGAIDGPGPVGSGSGDTVSANVTFAPWITNFKRRKCTA
jgi:parallel beta-helix repeat protein